MFLSFRTIVFKFQDNSFSFYDKYFLVLGQILGQVFLSFRASVFSSRTRFFNIYDKCF